MADVVVSAAFDLAGSHGQQGLATVQCLDLGFFVDTQHHSFVGWIQVQPDDVAELLDEERVDG